MPGSRRGQLLQNPLQIDEAGLLQHHAHALVLPGVDGDVMSVRTPAEITRRQFAAAVQSAAEAAGTGCVDLSEAEFVDRLAMS